VSLEADISRAADVLRRGGLVVFPTETVYGIGCDATNPAAVARLFAAKGRPRFNPLIAHVSDLSAAHTHARLPREAVTLACTHWPGPLTLVAPRAETSPISDLACAGSSSVGIRAPAHPLARTLLRAFAGPIAAPSANRSGHVSATTVDHARDDLGEAVDMYLDGGPCVLGVESTIVGFRGDGAATLLRPGAVPRADVEVVTGPLRTPAAGTIDAPGMLASHYAPRARLRLDADAPLPGEAYLAFDGPAPPGGLTLSPTGDLLEAAANLYSHLRALDAGGGDTIAVARIPGHGLGEAIRDRLARAAAPR